MAWEVIVVVDDADGEDEYVHFSGLDEVRTGDNSITFGPRINVPTIIGHMRRNMISRGG